MFTLNSTSDSVFVLKNGQKNVDDIQLYLKSHLELIMIAWISLRKHRAHSITSFVLLLLFALEILSYSVANMAKKCHVYEEFSTPQLQNKYLLIISNWPSFPTDRWLGHMKASVIVRVAAFMWRGADCDAAVKNKNGRLSLNTMTSFLSLSLAAYISQDGEEVGGRKKNLHLALIREDANLKEGAWRPQGLHTCIWSHDTPGPL